MVLGFMFLGFRDYVFNVLRFTLFEVLGFTFSLFKALWF